MRANTGLIMPTTTTLLVKVQDLQQKLQLGGNQSLPSQLEARLVSHNKCLRLVDCRNDPDTQQNNFTIRVIISQFPRGRLEIMRA